MSGRYQQVPNAVHSPQRDDCANEGLLPDSGVEELVEGDTQDGLRFRGSRG